ncbi:MAG: site-specific DNA-methyltransferase [Clostridia bacterium]|nr:site-specific DNA-methyltransferase [Clostridia bacterium]
MSNKLELTWVGKNEKINPEPRILLEDIEKSYGDPQTENMLIHGDNLLALKALESKYSNKIKCIYIDPPYNANATNVPFDDNIEHSFYLSLMKCRLEILVKLLKEDGVLCIQCDYNEMAYLKVLCDEIFGRNNYVTMVTVKTSSESGVKVNANKPAKVSEYILIYAKNKDKMVYKPIRIVTGYDKNYSQYIINPEDNYNEWQYANIKDILAQQLNKAKKDLKDEELRTFQIDNRDRVFSVRDISDSLKKYIKDNGIDKNIAYEYTTSTGKKTLLYKNGEIVFVKNKVYEIDGKLELTKIASDIWLDIPWDGIANEGGVTLKNSKKPEKLIQRIFEGFTDEEDLVLDSFLGSGTTCAVAMKMNRKCIGIELRRTMLFYE